MTSLQGHLLIASPEMPDSDFSKTVVLLVEHVADGAYGLVLNHPTDATIQEAWVQAGKGHCDLRSPVYAGGPCGEFLTALHANPALSNIEMLPGLYFTQEPDKLERLVQQGVEPIKFFVGFAGWGEGQLEEELQDGSWLVLPANPVRILTCTDELWLRVVREMFGEYVLFALDLKHRPEDPSMN
jgi:putative transcriptional regulator